jgi:hypothetical protein
MFHQLWFKFRIHDLGSGSTRSSRAAAPACLTVLMLLCAWANAFAADATPASAPVRTKMAFPDGTATPSEACGACHIMTFREMSNGTGTDLNWKSMKVQSTSKALLDLPPNISRSATAHFVAGTDPWPIESARVEENGKKCNVCHYPQALEYPEILSTTIDKPKPRDLHQERGVTCASCHLTPEGKIRGPYVVDAPHETVADERIRTSAACAYCHSAGARVVGKQTQTFLEWREDFNKPGLGPQHCQDCHMPKTVRKLAEAFDVPERVVARHTLTGSHSFARVASALNLTIEQTKDGRAELALHVVNTGAGHSVPTGSNRRAIYLTAELVNAKGKIVASKDWMFAPWMLGRPDDKKYVEEDLKGEDPIATSQADAQGPHETIIRAGEDRVLDWSPPAPAGQYTVRATLTYDLNRYNDRAFKADQYEIGKASLPINVVSPTNVSHAGGNSAER